jgi:hypothetical protein
MTEDIVINVPKDWDDKKKQDLVDQLQGLKFSGEYRILITNKMDVKFVDFETMEKMRDG